jgi:sulfur-oxidizing protein SoxY
MKVHMNRRQAMGLTLAGAAVAVVGLPVVRSDAATEALDAAIAEFTGGAEMAEGRIRLSTPEIAENGNTVPIEVDVDSDMTPESYVESVIVLADGNPNPGVVTFHFSPASGAAVAKTRIRLAKTQNVIAVAKMNDGSFYRASNEVKVTIGGCGG